MARSCSAWERLAWAARHSGETALLETLHEIYAALENESHKVRFLMDLGIKGPPPAFMYLFDRISDEEVRRLMDHSSAFADFLPFGVSFGMDPDEPIYQLIGDGDAVRERAKRLLEESGALHKPADEG